LNVQDAVYLNEVMETIARGAMHIRFGDATSLQIGAENAVSLTNMSMACSNIRR